MSFKLPVLLFSVLGLTACFGDLTSAPELQGKYDVKTHLYSSKSGDFSIFFPASPPGDTRYHGMDTHIAGSESTYVYYNSADICYAIAREEGYQVVGTWTPLLAAERIDSHLKTIVKEMRGQETTARMHVNLMGGLYMGKEAAGTLPNKKAFRLRQYVKTQPDYKGFVLMATGEPSQVNSAQTDRFFTSLFIRQ